MTRPTWQVYIMMSNLHNAYCFREVTSEDVSERNFQSAFNNGVAQFDLGYYHP